jgi:serine/threonine protein kinase
VNEAWDDVLQEGAYVAPGYAVVAHLYRSNSFDVYDVFSEERASRCIAKLPMPKRVEDAKVRSRLLREGRLLLKLTHPHIVRAYEVFRGPAPVVILETLTGETLARMIERRELAGERRLPLRGAAFLGLHLCSAMHYLHHHGILHLDLKPSNIVSERGLAKVLDLSIAQRPGRGVPGAGTRNYMAPEQATGGYLGPAADVWGIGAAMFETITGEVPFEAYGDTDYVDDEDDRYDQLERRAESVRRYRRVPRAFADAIDACLEPDPDDRPTVEQLSSSLTSFLQDPPSSAR